MRAAGRQVRRGMTLMELVVAVTLITMLISAMLTFFWQSAEIRDQAARYADRTQIARQVLSRVAMELRSCVGLEQVGFISVGQMGASFDREREIIVQEGGEEAEEEEPQLGPDGVPLNLATVRLLGSRRNITFLTATLPAEEMYEFYNEFADRPPGQHDLREVSYRLWIDPEETLDNGDPKVGGLIRTEKKTLNQALIEEDDWLQIRNDLWSPEIGYIEFRYFDGVEWTVDWNVTEGNSLPQAIQITVGFDSITRAELEDEDLDQYPIEQPEYALGDDQEHPDRYSVIVRLPSADRMFSSRLNRMGEAFGEQFGVDEGF